VPLPPDRDHAGGPELDPEALERALRFIEYRPRSTGETRSRLRRYGYDAQTATQITDHLVSVGILEDRAFANLYMDELIRKGMGCRRVRQELFKKMLDRDVVDEVMESYPLDLETERASEAAGRLLSRISGDDPSGARRKLSAYLMRRGYSRAVAEAVCRQTVRVDTQ
jgi:regulatory protein